MGRTESAEEQTTEHRDDDYGLSAAARQVSARNYSSSSNGGAAVSLRPSVPPIHMEKSAVQWDSFRGWCIPFSS